MATTVCVDTLGAEGGIAISLDGCALALEHDSDLNLFLTGPKTELEAFAARFPGRVTFQATTEHIEMDEHPTVAIRKKRDSSIVVGCKAVKEGRADAFFSAGNTGACLSAATLHIGRIKGVERPGLATPIPSPNGVCVLMDVGANADCKPEYLLRFGQMARVYTKIVLGKENPSVALLNIGEEETKGSMFAQSTFALMKENLEGFAGNAEGTDIAKASFDIIITDGFTGNIVLKTIEGVAKTLMKSMKDIFMTNMLTKVGALSIKGTLQEFKEQNSSDSFGGAVLLGVKKAVIIGHGSSNATAVANGIRVAAQTARECMPEQIERAINA